MTIYDKMPHTERILLRNQLVEQLAKEPQNALTIRAQIAGIDEAEERRMQVIRLTLYRMD